MSFSAKSKAYVIYNVSYIIWYVLFNTYCKCIRTFNYFCILLLPLLHSPQLYFTLSGSSLLYSTLHCSNTILYYTLLYIKSTSSPEPPVLPYLHPSHQVFHWGWFASREAQELKNNLLASLGVSVSSSSLKSGKVIRTHIQTHKHTSSPTNLPPSHTHTPTIWQCVEMCQGA